MMNTANTVKFLTILGLIELTLSHPVLLAVFLTANYIIGQLDESQKEIIVNYFKKNDFGFTTILDFIGNFFKQSIEEEEQAKKDKPFDYFPNMD